MKNYKASSKPTGSPFDVYQMVTDKLLKQIEEAGKLPWTKPWKCVGGGNFPMNGRTKRRYEGVNFFLLQFSGYTSPYWLSFKQVEELKGNVKKGEKATQIVFWKVNQYTDTDAETGKETKKSVPLLRYYNVFNVEQCEGITIKDNTPPVVYNSNDPIEISETVIDQYGKLQPALTMRVQESPQAYYMPGKDLVNMPELKQFESSEAFYATYFHELGHSTGHETRLNRKAITAGTAYFGGNDYGEEELTAELTASFICAEIGLNNETQENRSAAYLKNWMHAIKADKKLFIMAAGRASKAANLILNRKEVTEEEIN